MSNLSTAKKAIESELARAEQGLIFYRNHVESLKAALTKLGKVEDGVIRALNSKEARKKPSTKLAKQAAPRSKIGSSKTSKIPARPSKDLPKTGMEFWLHYITEEARTAAEVTRAAIAGLGFVPTQEQIKVLKQRVGPSLEAMVKNGKIKDSGVGRERRFVLVRTNVRSPGRPAAESVTAH